MSKNLFRLFHSSPFTRSPSSSQPIRAYLLMEVAQVAEINYPKAPEATVHKAVAAKVRAAISESDTIKHADSNIVVLPRDEQLGSVVLVGKGQAAALVKSLAYDRDVDRRMREMKEEYTARFAEQDEKLAEQKDKLAEQEDRLRHLRQATISGELVAPSETARAIIEVACRWPPSTKTMKGGALLARTSSLRRVVQCAIQDLDAGTHLEHTPAPDKRVHFKTVRDVFGDAEKLATALRYLAPCLSDENVEKRHAGVHLARQPERLLNLVLALLMEDSAGGSLPWAEEVVLALFSVIRANPDHVDLSAQERLYQRLQRKQRKV